MSNVTFSELEARLSRFLANSGTSDFLPEERQQALNDVLRIDLMEYNDGKWGHLKVKTDLTFTLGLASLPTDFNTEHRLYEESTDERVQQEYDKVDQDMFVDNLLYKYTVTIDSGVQKLKIYPNDSTTLLFWYYKTPLTSDISGSTDTGFDYKFSHPIAQLAAARLLETKDPSDPRIGLFRYGQSGNFQSPSPDSAYGKLSKMFRMERRKVQKQNQSLTYIYDRSHYNFDPFFNY